MALLWNQCFFLKKFSLAEIDIIYEGMFRSILNFTSQMQMSSQMSSWRRSYGRNGHGIFCRRWGWRVHVDSPKLLYRGPWRQKHHPNMTTLLSVTAQTKQQYTRQSDTLCMWILLHILIFGEQTWLTSEIHLKHLWKDIDMSHK